MDGDMKASTSYLVTASISIPRIKRPDKRLGTAYSIKTVSHPGFFLLLFQKNPKGFVKPVAKSGSETFDLVSGLQGVLRTEDSQG